MGLSNNFQVGQLLKWIEFPDGGGPVVGQCGCTKIEVVFEKGQMAGVPWANAYHEDGRIVKYNLSLAFATGLVERTGQ